MPASATNSAPTTPRAYVERLVLPTVIEPLRAEWRRSARPPRSPGSRPADLEAVAEVQAFHRHLCTVRYSTRPAAAATSCM